MCHARAIWIDRWWGTSCTGWGGAPTLETQIPHFLLLATGLLAQPELVESFCSLNLWLPNCSTDHRKPFGVPHSKTTGCSLGQQIPDIPLLGSFVGSTLSTGHSQHTVLSTPLRWQPAANAAGISWNFQRGHFIFHLKKRKQRTRHCPVSQLMEVTAMEEATMAEATEAAIPWLVMILGMVLKGGGRVRTD